jgi:hypothetical protein
VFPVRYELAFLIIVNMDLKIYFFLSLITKSSSLHINFFTSLRFTLSPTKQRALLPGRFKAEHFSSPPIRCIVLQSFPLHFLFPLLKVKVPLCLSTTP